MENTNYHWLKVDYRAESLFQIISGLVNSINKLKERQEEGGWYDGLWLLEDTEPIFGLAFIAFQNYINGTIKDFYNTTDNKVVFYKIEPNLNGFEKSSIELIIGLANYIKHKEDSKLLNGTKNILDCFGLNNSDEITESPIFNGLDLLDSNWDLFNVLEIVKSWREKLFENYIKSPAEI